MQDHPAAHELLDAVAEYLVAELRPDVPSEQRFKVLVAANLCAVVARELRAGEAPSVADAELFNALAGGGEGPPAPGEADAEAERRAQELVKIIRAGEADQRLPELLEALSEHVARKLEVSRPGYTEPR
jgi:hypothetical protein